MQHTKQLKDVVILGGGTAGWITASLLIKLLGKSIRITLVESDEIGSIVTGKQQVYRDWETGVVLPIVFVRNGEYGMVYTVYGSIS